MTRNKTRSKRNQSEEFFQSVLSMNNYVLKTFYDIWQQWRGLTVTQPSMLILTNTFITTKSSSSVLQLERAGSPALHFIGTSVRSGVTRGLARGGGAAGHGGRSSSHRGNALPLTCRTCSRRYYNPNETERDVNREWLKRDKDAVKEKMTRQ